MSGRFACDVDVTERSVRVGIIMQNNLVWGRNGSLILACNTITDYLRTRSGRMTLEIYFKYNQTIKNSITAHRLERPLNTYICMSWHWENLKPSLGYKTYTRKLVF